MADVLLDHSEGVCLPFYTRVWEAGPMENFHHVIGDPLTSQALIVDPAFRLDQIFERAERDGFPITAAILTHGHRDHIGGLDVAVALGVRTVFLPPGLLDHPLVAKLDMTKVVMAHNQVEEFGTLRIQAIATPGHQPESTSYLVEDHALLTGDTLFIDSCGRTDFPGGDTKAMFNSLQLLKPYSNALLLVGHNYGHTPTDSVESQLIRNPALAADWDAFQTLDCLSN